MEHSESKQLSINEKEADKEPEQTSFKVNPVQNDEEDMEKKVFNIEEFKKEEQNQEEKVDKQLIDPTQTQIESDKPKHNRAKTQFFAPKTSYLFLKKRPEIQTAFISTLNGFSNLKSSNIMKNSVSPIHFSKSKRFSANPCETKNVTFLGGTEGQVLGYNLYKRGFGMTYSKKWSILDSAKPDGPSPQQYGDIKLSPRQVSFNSTTCRFGAGWESYSKVCNIDRSVIGIDPVVQTVGPCNFSPSHETSKKSPNKISMHPRFPTVDDHMKARDPRPGPGQHQVKPEKDWQLGKHKTYSASLGRGYKVYGAPKHLIKLPGPGQYDEGRTMSNKIQSKLNQSVQQSPSKDGRLPHIYGQSFRDCSFATPLSGTPFNPLGHFKGDVSSTEQSYMSFRKQGFNTSRAEDCKIMEESFITNTRGRTELAIVPSPEK